MPDVFVPIDTAQITKFHIALRRNNLINEATLRYIDNHRKALRQQYKTLSSMKLLLLQKPRKLRRKTIKNWQKR